MIKVDLNIDDEYAVPKMDMTYASYDEVVRYIKGCENKLGRLGIIDVLLSFSQEAVADVQTVGDAILKINSCPDFQPYVERQKVYFKILIDILEELTVDSTANCERYIRQLVVVQNRIEQDRHSLSEGNRNDVTLMSEPSPEVSLIKFKDIVSILHPVMGYKYICFFIGNIKNINRMD